MIRPAAIADLSTIVEVGRRMHEESPRWNRLRYSPARVEAYVRALIEGDNGLVLVAERNGVIEGGLMGFVGPHWSSDDLVAYELSLFMLPEARGQMAVVRLVDELRVWAAMKGAKFVQVGTSTGVDPERTAQFYERLGFTRCTIGLEYWNG